MKKKSYRRKNISLLESVNCNGIFFLFSSKQFRFANQSSACCYTSGDEQLLFSNLFRGSGWKKLQLSYQLLKIVTCDLIAIAIVALARSLYLLFSFAAAWTTFQSYRPSRWQRNCVYIQTKFNSFHFIASPYIPRERENNVPMYWFTYMHDVYLFDGKPTVSRPIFLSLPLSASMYVSNDTIQSHVAVNVR